MSFTPGPWTVEPRHSNAVRWRVHVGRRTVANVPPADTQTEGDHHEADARLIAAAPELLAALEQVDGMALRAGGGGSWGMSYYNIHQLAAAAIAKATGTEVGA